jgi:ubiquinone/menaquinone biosynthesis C-methylase UbiE
MTNTPDNNTIDFFNQRAVEGRFDSYSEQDILKLLALLDDIQFPVGEKLDILDCGCGAGRAMDLLASRLSPGSKIVGADLSPAMIERARAIRKPPNGVTFEFQVADCRSLPFKDETFDWVFAIDTFPHFRDFPAALAELKRVLKDGGYLAILNRECSDEVNRHHKEIGGPVSGDLMPDAIEFLQLLRLSGLWGQIYVDDPDGFRSLARK